ncbi:MAG TPA: SDR family NAD(P)-dependent oxidoreductase [Casimicrobiaceae bacterium]
MTIRWAIVTGVSQGLGEALALELLARGASVLGIGRRSSPRLGGDRYRFTACDLADVTSSMSHVEPALHAVAATNPAAVCLVNNAATIEHVGVLGTLGPDDIDRSLRINLAAPTALADLFCRIFGDAIERRIINVSSGAAHHAIAGESLYSIAKAGLEMLTQALAAEHASPRFQAITLRPGIIDTPMQAFARSRPASSFPSVAMFQQFHASGQLVAPDVVARKVVARLVEGAVESGRVYSYAQL